MAVAVRFEQAVYGSFPFRSTGYGLLAASPGCRPEWLSAFEAACRGIGEKPPGSGDLTGMMFAMPLGRRGPWMVVGVSTPGSDDRGRPDALAFHALFVEGREFRKVGYDPFALAPALRSDWGPGTTLRSGSIAAEGAAGQGRSDPRTVAVAACLKRRRKVALESASPILDLARDVWRSLPESTRRGLSVATWAFSDSIAYDLLAAPSLAAWRPDRGYVDPFAQATACDPPASLSEAGPDASLAPRLSIGRWAVFSVLVALAMVAVAIAAWAAGEGLARRLGWSGTGAGGATAVPRRPLASPSEAGPDRGAYPPDDLSVGDRREVAERLRGLAESLPGAGGAEGEPTALMRRIAAVRYDGPLLSDAERSAIDRDGGPGRSRALAADRLIRRFVPDRRLPDDFETGPLRWQIDTLVWRFHLDPEPRLTPREAIDVLAEALMPDEPGGRNPLEVRYPTLAAYRAFLERLPGR